MKHHLLSAFFLVTLSLTLNAQNVNIPDANFKAYLVSNIFLNTNSDTEIQVSEAAAYNTQLNCSSLSITDLTGIEAFTAMTSLHCDDNLLTSLDVSACSSLLYLYCQDNLLTSLNFSPAVREITCSNNQLTSIDLSANTDLYILFCNNNQLVSLNVANGNNEIMWTNGFNTTGNPSLNCIEVDDAFFSLNNWWYIDSWTSYSIDCNSGLGCTVTIPDVNFKNYLVGNSAINTNADSEIQCSEAMSFTGTIDCSSLNISNLIGIEAFTSLTYLECFNNQIASLNVNNNTALIGLSCNTNQLTTLNVSSITTLSSLNCGNNLLTSIDVSNTVLTDLVCNNNQLTSLDVASNTALTSLNCQNNPITTLDVSNNAALLSLNCMFNQLTNLSLSNSITVLQCTNNQLTSIDVSANSGLTVIGCANNQLTTLNVKNGNNTNISNGFFTINNNPNLTCVEVDDAAFSTANWTFIDAGVSFSEDCALSLNTNNNRMEAIEFFPNPSNDMLNIQSENLIESVTIFNSVGSLVQTETVSSFSVANLPSGVYTISVKTSEGFSVNRFIKQ